MPDYSSQTQNRSRFKPVLVWPLLQNGPGLIVRRRRAEAVDPEEARLRAIDSQSSRWLWATKIWVFGWRAGTDLRSESGKDGLWLMAVADNPVGARVGCRPGPSRRMRDCIRGLSRPCRHRFRGPFPAH
jgi:hypothetical protein